MLRSVLRRPRLLLAAAGATLLAAVVLLPLAQASSGHPHQEQQQQQHHQPRKEDSASSKLAVGDGEAVPAVLRSGPYATSSTTAQLTIRDDVTPACTGNGCTLKLYLTAPVRTPNLAPGSVPIVLMFSGFQLPSSYYTIYAHALATWGFAALAYDLPGAVLQKVIRDDEEVKFVPVLLHWLSQQYQDPASAVYELLDFRSVAGFGHSRGAKLAALSLVGGVGGMSTAILMDPVDMTPITRQRGYPSAVQALSQSPQKALLIGSGITGWCNPAGEGWAAFWPVLQPGSWLQRVLPAGHMQFLDVKGVSAWSLDRLCGAGNVTHKVVIHWAQGGAVAWLLDTFKRKQSQGAITEWLEWVAQQTGTIEWSVKAATTGAAEAQADATLETPAQQDADVVEAGATVRAAAAGSGGQAATA